MELESQTRTLSVSQTHHEIGSSFLCRRHDLHRVGHFGYDQAMVARRHEARPQADETWLVPAGADLRAATVDGTRRATHRAPGCDGKSLVAKANPQNWDLRIGPEPLHHHSGVLRYSRPRGQDDEARRDRIDLVLELVKQEVAAQRRHNGARRAKLVNKIEYKTVAMIENENMFVFRNHVELRSASATASLGARAL